MDYEKKYKEALERARQFSEKPYLEDSKGIVDYIFPELKESEDTEIKRLIKVAINGWFTSEGMIYEKESVEETKKKCLSWVEKQGEQKHADKVEPRFKINDKVIHKETGKTWTIHWYLADTNSYYVIDEEELINHYSEDVLESAEQKPAEWSEEDEQLYNDLSDTYFYNDEDYPEKTYKLMLKRVLDWMTKRAKSLRPQSQWKPSDAQMRVLDLAIRCGINRGTTEETTLVSLFNDLKKLKEE